MSTATPLPLPPLPPDTLSHAEARAWKQEVASRLADHRQRRPRSGTGTQAVLPLDSAPAPRKRIASSVAARFSQRESYREFLQHEAEAAIHQAEAEAEVARRTADAIVAAQQQLLEEIDHWNASGPERQEPTAVILMDAVDRSAPHMSQTVALEAASAEAPSQAAAAPQDESPSHAATASVQQGGVSGTPLTEASSSVSPTAHAAAHVAGSAAAPLPHEPSIPLPTNLIEFPRQLVAARRARPRLAEGPLRNEAPSTPERAQLRIFEVEASSVSTVAATESVLPEWHTIRLEATEQSRETADPGSEISFALPLDVAPRSLRAMATLVDTCCIATGFLLAVAAAASVSTALPNGVPALLASGILLGALWLFYQVLFFSLSDATPGMRYARIGLCTFADENPTRAGTLRRIGARLLAGMPLGLGLLWACLDDEGLGWHDRISRMYPRAY